MESGTTAPPPRRSSPRCSALSASASPGPPHGVDGRPRTPQLELTSESSWPGFGHKFASDGAVVVAYDLSARDRWSFVLRILRTTEAGLVEEGRFELPPGDSVVALDVSDERVVAQLESKQLVFFEHQGRWTKRQTLPLAGPCLEAYQHLDMAGDTVAIGAEHAVCVFDRRGGIWRPTAEVPTEAGFRPITNGDRIAQRTAGDFDGVSIARRDGDHWRTERVLLGPSARRYIDAIAISCRWLAVTVRGYEGEARVIEVYELGETIERVAVLHPQVDDRTFGISLAISDAMLLASGETHQLFRMSNRGWEPDGQLAPPRPHFWYQGELGDVVWLSEAGLDLIRSGAIHGYRIDGAHETRGQ